MSDLEKGGWGVCAILALVIAVLVWRRFVQKLPVSLEGFTTAIGWNKGVVK